MKAITIKELAELCNSEIGKGNGNKQILISSDDEGNSYHFLWSGFAESKQEFEDAQSFSYGLEDLDFENYTILG